jgi:hypothetical protein
MLSCCFLAIACVSIIGFIMIYIGIPVSTLLRSYLPLGSGPGSGPTSLTLMSVHTDVTS